MLLRRNAFGTLVVLAFLAAGVAAAAGGGVAPRAGVASVPARVLAK